MHVFLFQENIFLTVTKFLNFLLLQFCKKIFLLLHCTFQCIFHRRLVNNKKVSKTLILFAQSITPLKNFNICFDIFQKRKKKMKEKQHYGILSVTVIIKPQNFMHGILN